jgi:carbon-monoxide dehydrogenase large subunit
MAQSEFTRHLTGSGQFTDDLRIEGVLYGQVLRSPHAHAKFRDIRTEAALAAPGVVAIFTGADLERAGVGSIPCHWPVEQSDGSPMATPPYPPLSLERARHVGDAIAFVVAESREAAVDGVERIEVDYTPLPSVTDAEDALSAAAPLLWTEAPGNVCFRCEFGDAAATDATFAETNTIVKRRYKFPRVLAHSLETRSALAIPEAHGITLHTQSQGVQYLRGVLAGVLGCGEGTLHVVTPDVGGSFGMKAFLYPEQVLVAHAARRLGRPVKWAAERSSEAFLADTHARDQLFDIELALDDAGRFRALRVSTIANLGAYLSLFGPLNSTAADRFPGPYDIPTAHVVVTGAFTNTAPVDAYRGAARAETVFPVERIVDAAARELGIDPPELRRRNFARSAEPRRTNCLGLTIDNSDYESCLDEALARFDWAGRASRRAKAHAGGRLYGAGLASYATTTMGGGEQVRLEVDTNGKVCLLVGTQSSGQGHETAFASAVATALSIDPERVQVIQGDTRLFDVESITGGSRSIASVVPASEEAARAWIERGRSVAAALSQTEATRISYQNGTFANAATGARLGLKDLVSAAVEAGLSDTEPRPCLAVVGRHDPEKGTNPSGTHVCELEIDPETGAATLLRYVSVDDVGRVLTPDLAAGQIHGGVAQGFGQAMLEVCRYDRDTGQLVSGSFLDYALPRADDLPFFESSFHQEQGALPLRGLGEMGTIASTPAILNAVTDALAQIGGENIEVPATPERIWRACQCATSRSGKAAGE